MRVIRNVGIVVLIGGLTLVAAQCQKEGETKGEGPASVFDQNKKCFGEGDKVVNLTTLDWQPYIGADMKDFGPNHEVVVTAFQRKGYKVCTAFFTWERTHKMGVEGQEADGYFPEYYSKDYEKDLVFSDGYPAGPAGFMKRTDKKVGFKTKSGMKDFKALKPYRIGVVRGYVNTAPLDDAIGQFVDDIKDPAALKTAKKAAYLYKNRDQADSDAQNIEKLYNDRVQIAFLDPNVAQYHIQKSLSKKYPDIGKKLVFMEPPLIVHKVYTCISRKAPNYEQKIKDFNDGLREIRNDGTLKSIYTKHGFTTRDGVNFTFKG